MAHRVDLSCKKPVDFLQYRCLDVVRCCSVGILHSIVTPFRKLPSHLRDLLLQLLKTSQESQLKKVSELRD